MSHITIDMAELQTIIRMVVKEVLQQQNDNRAIDSHNIAEKLRQGRQDDLEAFRSTYGALADDPLTIPPRFTLVPSEAK